MPRKDRRHSIDRSGFPTSGTMNKTMRPARYVRGGEALSVASRGEHGHHPVITSPMNRFCPDRNGTPLTARSRLELDSHIQRRRQTIKTHPRPLSPCTVGTNARRPNVTTHAGLCLLSGLMNKTIRPARYVRGGEALSVASRGEHGHHPVITLPMNRFCPDQIESGRAALPVPTFARYAFSMYPGQSRRQ